MVKLHGMNHVNLARILYNSVCKDTGPQIWVQVPLATPDENKYENVDESENAAVSSWHWWNRFRLIANQNLRINVCLEIGENVPDENEIQRWLGEPIKTLLFNTSVFLTNKGVSCTS